MSDLRTPFMGLLVFTGLLILFTTGLSAGVYITGGWLRAVLFTSLIPPVLLLFFIIRNFIKYVL